MKKTKERGITLIALVVTIVVLLILAGTSISMLTGENGIITQTNEAKLQTEIGEEKEAVKIAYSGAKGEKLCKQVTAQDVQKQLDINETEAIASGNIQVRFIKSGRIYKLRGSNIDGPFENIEATKTLVEMFKQAETDGCTLTHDTCSNPEHLHVGYYLDYVPELENTVSVEKKETGYDETQTYKTNLTTTWRVLGLNGDKTEVQIISGSPLKKEETGTYLNLQGAEGYIYGKQVLDKISAIYKNGYATEARSMRIEDINNAIGIINEGNIIYKKGDTEKENIDSFGVLGQTYTYKEGDQTPESYLGIKDVKVGDKVTITGYAYNYDNDELLSKNSVLWKMLFDGTTSEKRNAKAYWLASQKIALSSDNVLFGMSNVYIGKAGDVYMFESSGNIIKSVTCAVRPLISIKSNVTENEIPIITGEEEDWNIENMPERPGRPAM